MNPKEVFHNTAYSIQLPYIAGHSKVTKIHGVKNESARTKKTTGRGGAPYATPACLGLNPGNENVKKLKF